MNKIYVTGDTHGGFGRFSAKHLPQLKIMDRNDYMIITGDFGGVWSGTQAENSRLKWLEDKPFTTLFVDGNHENFDRLNALPVEEWHGGKIHRITDHIIHLMRGQVFEIGGLTFFTMGGAASHDIDDGILDPTEPDFERRYWQLRRMGAYFRVLRYSWWPEEMPSEAEYEEALANLDRVGWCVDCVLTHSAPSGILPQISPDYKPDRLTDFLETVRRRCRFSKWFFGHYHTNMDVDERFTLQWEQISQLSVN